MKYLYLCIFSIILAGQLAGQDARENIVTKTYYNKWNVTYESKALFEYERGSDDDAGGKNGYTILNYPLTMIDDGIYGSLGIMFTKEKKPEYIMGLSFPVGIGNKSYEDLANNDMTVRVVLMSNKDSILKSVNYGSLEDQVTVGGSEFKGRLYRFVIDSNEIRKLKSIVPNKMVIYFKSKNGKTKPKQHPDAGSIISENAMISKFSDLARSMDKVKVLEIN
jgi:hypothetical protein